MYLVLCLLIIILLVALIGLLMLLKSKNEAVRKVMRIYEIGNKITSNIKVNKLMNEIMRIAKEETGAEACSLYLIDEEKHELWFEVAMGEKGDMVKEIRLKIGEGIAGWVAKEGKTLNLTDVNQDPRFRKDIGEKIEFKQKAMLTIPVIFKNKVTGVLQVINKLSGGSFTKQDQELLEGMCSQIAIALENAQLYENMREMFIDSINALASAIDAKDPYTNGHSKRVTEYAIKTAKVMGLSEEQLEVLEYMAVLHDVGKIGISDAILNKQSQLNDEEFAVMKSHTIIGEKILTSMKSLKKLTDGAKYHHEKYDGTGYYDKLKGMDIPLEARIISVADTYDAMTTDRPYRKGLDNDTAINELRRCSGTQFDPDVVKCFIEAMNGKTVA